MATLLDDIIGRLGTLPDKQRAEIVEKAMQATAHMAWLPNSGPQTSAYFSQANVLGYGGQGGGGKTDLILGLAFTAHKRTLMMRRKYVDLGAITERAIEINTTRDGFNGSSPPKLRTKDSRLIEFGAAANLGDEQSWQGQPHDLLCLDEAVQFLEAQARFLMGWVRTTDPNQRCRVVLTSNPPVTADGQWIIPMFRPWLDLTHPKPAKPGELRWFITAPDGKDVEVEGPERVEIDGDTLIPQSRTFIPAALRDNPYLINTGYQAQLDALPEPYRSAVRDGNFMLARKDAMNQVIPTDWVIAAENRWREDACKSEPMSAMSFDPAGGGSDDAVLAWRHGGWYARPIADNGKQTADARNAMASIFLHRRDQAPVVVDVGGGYGGPAIQRMADNGVIYVKFNGAEKSTRRTLASKLPFANRRAEAWWRFREALDPDQDGGSAVALPPDPELRADLTTPCLDMRALEVRGVIQIESKQDIRTRIGRSPGKGDAVVMALTEGERAIRRHLLGLDPAEHAIARGGRPQVIMGHAAARKVMGR